NVHRKFPDEGEICGWPGYHQFCGNTGTRWCSASTSERTEDVRIDVRSKTIISIWWRHAGNPGPREGKVWRWESAA
ncbi:unnamed protein product, partial [Amoebophrya sp. A25]